MTGDAETKVWLVGGGIASLAAAAFMIRDGGLRGRNITIIEATEKTGGSLDGSGSPESGYVLRGGRMFESQYRCTFGLFDSIPALDGGRTVTQETVAFNQLMKTDSKSRLVRGGHRMTEPEFGLTEMHILTIERLAIEPEVMLGRTTIADQFDPAFFKTNFWFMWCSTFAFQPWHSAVELKRYLVRFAHMVEGFNRLKGIMRTAYNQYDSMVRPLMKWLDDHGVVFQLNTRVTDLRLTEGNGENTVAGIIYRRDGETGEIAIAATDLVLVTIGSMTEDSSLGSMDTAPCLTGKEHGGSWALWKAIAAGRPEMGRPTVFADHVADSRWVSFTMTLHDPLFLHTIRDFTGNSPGEGGLITFVDSSWLVSIVVPLQPHFIGQPTDVGVAWGYGLNVDNAGDFIKKPMSACTGREIMTEVLGHMRAAGVTSRILETSVCIPCMMPFITSQFLPRESGDRPNVIPEGSRNLALMGQFCELPEDVVFTVEYSIRSAQTATYALLGLDREPPAVYRGQFDPRVLFRAFMAVHDIHA